MERVVLKPSRESKLTERHPWIFNGDIKQVDGTPADGSEVTVVTHDLQLIGRGFYNSSSQITVRLFAYEDVSLTREYLLNRIKQGMDYRKKFFGKREVLRCVFSDGDLLPGLIIDKYGDVIVLQTLTLGIERKKSDVISIIDELFTPRIIYERNDVPTRKLEGLELSKGFLRGTDPHPVEIVIDGLKYEIDFVNGQKTGFFMDQKANTRLVRKLAKDLHVLDCFTHTGQFAINALRGGAKQVVGIDLSKLALEQARRNAELNGFTDNIQWAMANGFDALRNFDHYNAKFDMIILDPPAFCRSKATLEKAYSGYKEINLRAMKILKPDGILVTSSCSYHMTPDMFLSVLRDAATDAHRVFRVIGEATQDRDHPILLNVPETYYLKCFYINVC